MKRLLFLLFIFTCFAAGASAQLCGQYTTTLHIKTDDNKPLENAFVQLVSIGNDETKNKTFVRDENDRSKFSVVFYEGHVLTGKYKIFVLADGYATAEKEITFPHCKDQQFEFIFKTASASILTGTVLEANGAVVPGAKVTVVNQKGDKFETLTDEEGVYSLTLPFNRYDGSTNFREAKYDIIVEKAGFKRSLTKGFVFIPSQFGKMHFDIGLEIGRSDTISVRSDTNN